LSTQFAQKGIGGLTPLARVKREKTSLSRRSLLANLTSLPSTSKTTRGERDLRWRGKSLPEVRIGLQRGAGTILETHYSRHGLYRTLRGPLPFVPGKGCPIERDFSAHGKLYPGGGIFWWFFVINRRKKNGFRRAPLRCTCGHKRESLVIQRTVGPQTRKNHDPGVRTDLWWRDS